MQSQHKLFLIGIGMVLLVGLGAMSYPTPENQKSAPTLDDNTPLWEVMKKLGNNAAPDVKSNANVSAEKGKDLVMKGYTTGANGKKTSPQSKFFVCATCHNSVKEFESTAENSPEKRLEYAQKNNLPFLQASSFYGIVNRTSFYNGDYQKKYADKAGIKEASTDLRKAIQFCANTCAQGRELADWEVESILAYFWTLQYKIGDLKLAEQEQQILSGALDKGEGKDKAVQMLESKYLKAMPAHFAPIPKYEALAETELNNTDNQKEGKAIYELACLHCHYNKRYSFFGLDNERLTFKAMESATRTENYIFSMYYLVREGLAPRLGHRSYMPEFSMEKMSEKQLKNLYIYVHSMAKGKH